MNVTNQPPRRFINLFQRGAKFERVPTYFEDMGLIASFDFSDPNTGKNVVVSVANDLVHFFQSPKGAIVADWNERDPDYEFLLEQGGEALMMDKQALPRVRIGSAGITGPNDYDNLQVPYVIHAVGPNFNLYPNVTKEAMTLLEETIFAAFDKTCGTPIDQVAFSLISAGSSRGSLDLETIVNANVKAIVDWIWKDLIRPENVHNIEDVVLCAGSTFEAGLLVEACKRQLVEKEGLYAENTINMMLVSSLF